MIRPLEDLVILDLTHVWAGPLGTRILGDLGADVIKVEAHTARGPAAIRPGTGGPYQGDPADEPYNRQAGFNKLNRNKKSLAVDLKTTAGRELFVEMVRHADAVIENFSARAMKSLRLDYGHLKEVNPEIVYIAMPGYGSWGPISDYVAFGPSVELMTGLTSLFGYDDDSPATTSMALPDAIAGTTAATTMIAALHRKSREGKGGFVDLALHESAIAMLGEYLVEYQLTSRQPPVIGNRSRDFAPQGIYPCRPSRIGDEVVDGYICISCDSEEAWRGLADLAGDGWAQRPELSTVEGRIQRHDELDQLIGEFTRTRDKIELMNELQARGVPAGAVMVAPEFMSDPHVVARGYFVELGEPPIPFPGTPVKIDNERGVGWRRAPRLGEHNREVLSSLLGYSEEKIDELTRAGVLATRPPEPKPE